MICFLDSVLSMSVYIRVWLFACETVVTHRVQKRVSDPWELELRGLLLLHTAKLGNEQLREGLFPFQ